MSDLSLQSWSASSSYEFRYIASVISPPLFVSYWPQVYWGIKAARDLRKERPPLCLLWWSGRCIIFKAEMSGHGLLKASNSFFNLNIWVNVWPSVNSQYLLVFLGFFFFFEKINITFTFYIYRNVEIESFAFMLSSLRDGQVQRPHHCSHSTDPSIDLLLPSPLTLEQDPRYLNSSTWGNNSSQSHSTLFWLRTMALRRSSFSVLLTLSCEPLQCELETVVWWTEPHHLQKSQDKILK